MNFLPAELCGGPPGEIVGVRPHDLKPARRAAAGFTLTGELILIEPAGPFQFLDILFGDTVVRATTTDMTGLETGQTITVAADPNAVRIFSATDGRRIERPFVQAESRIHAI